MSNPEPLDFMANVEATAKAMARKKNLICDDGTIVCWECGQADALLPSLHCPICLAARWKTQGHHRPQCIQRTQTDKDRKEMRMP